MKTNYNRTQYVEQQLNQGISLDDLLRKSPNKSLKGYLSNCICRTNYSVEAIAELALINRASLYRILNGKQNPSFNVLIRLSRVLEMNYDQTQQLLKLGNNRTLSGGRQRDIVIMHGIMKNLNIDDLDQLLLDHNMEGLFSK